MAPTCLSQWSATAKTRAFWGFAAFAAVVVVVATTTATQVGDGSSGSGSAADGSAGAYQLTDANRSLLLLIGDSLTELGDSSDQAGWITLMRSQFSRSSDILSRGFIGFNSRWILEYALPLIERDLDNVPAPALITVWLGANDAALADGKSYLQHVPVDEYSANLQSIVARLRAKAPAAGVVLITPPPVNDEARRALNDGELERSNAQARVYAAACVALAEEVNATALDLYSYFNDMGEDERNACLVDGLHFNGKGNRLMQQRLVSAIRDAFPALAAALDTPQLPDWRVVLGVPSSRR